MTYLINLNNFKQNPLTFELDFWSGLKLMQNGKVLKKRNGTYTATNDSGQNIEIKVTGNPYFGVITVVDGNEQVQPIPVLKIYETVLMLLPFFMIPFGGLIGGFFGGSALAINFYLFRSSNYSSTLKIILSVVSFIVAMLLYFLVVFGILVLIN